MRALARLIASGLVIVGSVQLLAYIGLQRGVRGIPSNLFAVFLAAVVAVMGLALLGVRSPMRKDVRVTSTIIIAELPIAPAEPSRTGSNTPAPHSERPSTPPGTSDTATAG